MVGPMFPNLEQVIGEGDDAVDYGEQFKLMTNEERYMSVMKYSGTRVPFLQGGILNSFSYNRFTLSINLSYSIGSKIRLLKLYPNVLGVIRHMPLVRWKTLVMSFWIVGGSLE